MSKPRHLPLAQRKALSARLITLRTTRPKSLDFAKQGANSSFAELERTLFDRSAEGADSPDEDPLDWFLQQRIVTFLQSAPQLTGKYSKIFIPLVNELSQQMQKVNCASCANPSAICNGTILDDDVVANRGDCIQPVRAMFEIAIKNAQFFYSTLSTQPFTPEKIKTLFSTAFTLDSPHPFPNKYSVSGCTTYYDNGPVNLISEIELVFNIAGFDWDTYFACLYVLFHECISHAYQGMLLKQTRRRVTELRDCFAEGWMDLISLKVMEAALRADPAFIINLGRPYEEVAQVAESYHRSRLNFERFEYSKYKKDAIYWSVGVRAAQKFHRLLGILPETKASQEELFFQISFDLNLLEFDVLERESFVWNMDAYLAAEGELPAPHQFDSIADILRIYLKIKDINQFFKNIVNLPVQNIIHLTNE